MAHVAQMLTQEPIYKPSSIFCFEPILLSAHKLILLIYGDNNRHPCSPGRREGRGERKGPGTEGYEQVHFIGKVVTITFSI